MSARRPARRGQTALPCPVKIEKGIPVPPRNVKQLDWLSIFNAMSEGDSFIVPDNKARLLALHAASRWHATVVTRKIDRRGYRVWLIDKNLTPHP